MFKVLKKDGSTQTFDRNKVLDGIVKSGATLEIATQVTSEVEEAFSDKTDSDVVSYLDIKTEVAKSLETKDAECARRYSSFQK
jgi:transcriptional regulator NrdR family protein